MSKLQGVLIFVSGVAAGSAATYFVVRKKFEDIANEEIESVKAMCCKRVTEAEDSVNDDCFSTLSEDENRVKYYLDALRKMGVDDFFDDDDDIEEVNPVEKEGMAPEVIDEQIFISQGQDLQETLHFYATDKVLCDDQYEKIDDPRVLIGDEWDDLLACHYETHDANALSKDNLYIRNHERETDYEILIFKGSYEKAIMGEDDDDDEGEEDVKNMIHQMSEEYSERKDAKKRMAD